MTDTHLVFHSAGAFDRYTSQMRRALSINAHERLAIALLWDRGPMTMSELGAGIPLSRAAVTTLVDRLEQGGFVKRGGDAADRRRTVVTLVGDGGCGIDAIIVPWQEGLAEMRERFGDDWTIIRRYLAEFREMTNIYADQLSSMSDSELRQMSVSDSATSADAEQA